MRVTSTTLSDFVINGSQTAQQRLAVLQQQISSGNDVTQASDNPLAFSEASQTQANLAQLNAYTTSISDATTSTSTNNTAMTQIHQIIAQAGEYATSASGTMTTSDLQNLGTEMNALISQLTSVVNQQAPDGSYLFGGTSNQPPITSAGAYNTTTNGATTSTEVGQNNSVQTSIAAGNATTNGFLVDTSSGVDVLATLKQAVTDLNAGNATAVQSTDMAAINKALDHISMYVGSTAANMAAVTAASTQNTQLITSEGNQLNALTQTNLPVATVQLQQIQNQYEATLEAGTKVMNLSILNFLSTTS